MHQPDYVGALQVPLFIMPESRAKISLKEGSYQCFMVNTPHTHLEEEKKEVRKKENPLI